MRRPKSEWKKRPKVARTCGNCGGSLNKDDCPCKRCVCVFETLDIPVPGCYCDQGWEDLRIDLGLGAITNRIDEIDRIVGDGLRTVR